MQNKVSTIIIILLVIAYNIVIPLEIQAIDYYVDQNHPSASDINSGTEIRPWKTLTKANTTLVAGDNIYIKAGTYSTSYIAPSNSGTASQWITYRNYGTDVVTISGTSYAVYLDGKSYIKVQGINAYNCSQFIYIRSGGHHNEVSYGKFDRNSSPYTWSASLITDASTYNWIHHNTFSNCGSANSGGNDIGACFEIGQEDTTTFDASNYNLIDNNIFFHGGHHVVAIASSYNTFRNNYVHNEAWTGAYGNRNMYTVSPGSAPGRNLFEGNKIGYSWTPVDQGGSPSGSFKLGIPNSILRYNRIYHSAGPGLSLEAYTSCTPSPCSNSANNRIYNNTLFNNGLDATGGDATAVRVSTDVGQAPVGNVFKNNLYYSHYQVYAGDRYSAQIYANEYNGDVRGDPLFVNASMTPPTDKYDSTIPNLDLQSTSPAKDQGGPLTTVAAGDAGTGTSMVVSDPSYFQDGTFAPAGRIQADYIAVGTVSNTVQIASINYATKTITLTNSISRRSGQSVWLYKKSDGAVVLYGTAPDAGAYEIPEAFYPLAPLPPSNLWINQ